MSENKLLPAVTGEVRFRTPDEEPPPRGVKLLVRTSGGVALISDWTDASNFVAWSPLPKKERQMDAVNHPPHYTQGGIECIDALAAATVGKSGIEAVCTANVIKYLWRYEAKNGIEDVRKAQWYLNRLIQEMER